MTFEAITTAVGNLGTVLTTTLGTIADNAMIIVLKIGFFLHIVKLKKI